MAQKEIASADRQLAQYRADTAMDTACDAELSAADSRREPDPTAGLIGCECRGSNRHRREHEAQCPLAKGER